MMRLVTLFSLRQISACGVSIVSPFAAMLFGVSGIRYPRGVARDGAARIVYC